MSAKLPTLPAALLADARAIVAEATEIRTNRICRAPLVWIEDAVTAVLKANRSPKRFFGSADLSKVHTWAIGTGFDARVLAFVLVAMVDSGAVDAV